MAELPLERVQPALRRWDFAAGGCCMTGSGIIAWGDGRGGVYVHFHTGFGGCSGNLKPSRSRSSSATTGAGEVGGGASGTIGILDSVNVGRNPADKVR
jgi:hypothetical protein